MVRVLSDRLVIVRGGGDLATGIIQRLYNSGFRIVVLEKKNPSAIRRYVALSEAYYESLVHIEDMTCKYIGSTKEKSLKELEKEIHNCEDKGFIPLAVDPRGDMISFLKPFALVDAIIAKRNLGTTKDMAEVVIGVGPGFCAGKDVDFVIETQRGHNLGRVLTEGEAAANTGIPGMIGGYGKERVIHACGEGVLYGIAKISDIVEAGDVVAEIHNGDEVTPVKATIPGVLRGLIRDGYHVTKGFKIADIDPRLTERENCFTISDKARAIAGGVLEALLRKV